MQVVDLEAMSDEQIVPETVDHPVVKPKHPSALAALNMAMVVFGQVVDGGAVTQVDVLYQSQVAQGSQRSVDGGQVEFRVVALEALGELFGTDVSLGIVGQLGQYQPPPTSRARRADAGRPVTRRVGHETFGQLRVERSQLGRRDVVSVALRVGVATWVGCGLTNRRFIQRFREVA